MSWFWYLLAFLWTLDALRMRARVARFPVLTPAEGKPKASGAFISTTDVQLTGLVREQAGEYAETAGLELLDLIPRDTPTLLALAVTQLVDPLTYGRSRMEPAFSTGFAMFASDSVLARAQVHAPEVTDPVSLGRLARRLKRFVFTRASLAIVSELKATTDHLSSNWEVFDESIGRNSKGVFMLRVLMLLILATGLFVAPAAGLTALAAFHIQPLITFLSSALRPRDLWTVSLFRSLVELRAIIKTTATRRRSVREESARMETRRPYYEQMMRGGVEKFFQPRREDCPVCGSHRLRVRLRTTDIIQHKPGRFLLDKCQDCEHIFQNPRLTLEGLNFYYSDFYDGMSTRAADTMFSAHTELYHKRASTVSKFMTPERWLDVGTGHGHFCCAAREVWPKTRFDGLDICEGMDDAVRAGWLDRGYRGFLPDVAENMKAQYDVISLFHCLEHTPDPRKEIEAAHTALAPGGMLVIEVPDPECPLGRIFGRYWLPWFQPQHLNLLSVKNLERLMREKGFEPVQVEREEAHIPIDIFCFSMMVFSSLASKQNVPWLPPPTWFSRVRKFVVWNLGFPLLLMAMLLDVITGRLLPALGVSNAYRLVARRLPASTDVSLSDGRREEATPGAHVAAAAKAS